MSCRERPHKDTGHKTFFRERRDGKIEILYVYAIMNLTKAREIWGSMMNDEEIKEWLELRNKIRPEDHDPKIPKGATIVIEPNTGKHFPNGNF